MLTTVIPRWADSSRALDEAPAHGWKLVDISATGRRFSNREMTSIACREGATVSRKTSHRPGDRAA